jgi:hypothetical protein
VSFFLSIPCADRRLPTCPDSPSRYLHRQCVPSTSLVDRVDCPQPAPSATRAAFWARLRDRDRRRDRASAESPLFLGTIRPPPCVTPRSTGSRPARAIRRCRMTAWWHRRQSRAGRCRGSRSSVRCAGTRPQTAHSRVEPRRGFATGLTATGHGPS